MKIFLLFLMACITGMYFYVLFTMNGSLSPFKTSLAYLGASISFSGFVVGLYGLFYERLAREGMGNGGE